MWTEKCVKSVEIRSLFIYWVNLCIQSKYGKMWTIKNPEFVRLSRRLSYTCVDSDYISLPFWLQKLTKQKTLQENELSVKGEQMQVLKQQHENEIQVSATQLLKKNLFKKNFMPPFYGWGSTVSRLYRGHYEETIYFLPRSSQKLLVLIWSSSEGWKAESTVEPPSGFEHGTLGLGIQRLNVRSLLHYLTFERFLFVSVSISASCLVAEWKS